MKVGGFIIYTVHRDSVFEQKSSYIVLLTENTDQQFGRGVHARDGVLQVVEEFHPHF